MKKIILFLNLFFITNLFSFDAKYYENETGLKGTFKEEAFLVTFPDALATFTEANSNSFIVWGEVSSYGEELNSKLSVLLDQDFEITALNNDSKIYRIYYTGIGKLKNLAQVVKKIVENSQATPQKKNSINAKKLEIIFGMPSENDNGEVAFTKIRNIELYGAQLEIKSWVKFGEEHSKSSVSGEFALTEGELQQVLKILHSGNLNITAIHNHLTMEEPRIIFVHFEGFGPSESFAKILRQAFDVIL